MLVNKMKMRENVAGGRMRQGVMNTRSIPRDCPFVSNHFIPFVVDVRRLDFRVGLITKAERHPEAEKLYVEQGFFLSGSNIGKS